MSESIIESFMPGPRKGKSLQVGLFFGSFNPIHTGHLILAQTVLNETELDYLWFVISPQNPFKVKRNLLPAYDRLKMAEMAVEDNARLMASNVEFSLPKPSYTIDTLTHLRDTYQRYTFSLVMGQDNLQHLHKWKNAEAILKYYTLYVYPRAESKPSELDDHPHVKFVHAPLLNISATYIREALKAGKSIRYMVPEAVRAYIENEGFFSGTSGAHYS